MPRILWLTKRRYMNKDLLFDSYGRYFEIPSRLSGYGCELFMLLLAYRKEESSSLRDSKGVFWETINIRSFWNYYKRAAELIKEKNIELIIGSSDIQYCLLACMLGKCYRLPVICDIYDNFETYASGKIPGLSHIFYKKLSGTAANVVFTDMLGEYLKQKSASSNYFVIPNCIDHKIFYRQDQAECRTRLGFSKENKLLGYFGAISHSRSINTVFEAFSELHHKDQTLRLVMAGKKDSNVIISGSGIEYLGEFPHREIPLLINACDINIISYRNNAFARYSFPYKAAEYIACQRPFVAPNVGDMPTFLKEFPEYLYSLEDSNSLIARIKDLLKKSSFQFPEIITWDTAAKKYMTVINTVLRTTAM